MIRIHISNLNVNETKELVVDFRKKTHTHVYISNTRFRQISFLVLFSLFFSSFFWVCSIKGLQHEFCYITLCCIMLNK